jgi:hypothetical protein
MQRKMRNGQHVQYSTHSLYAHTSEKYTKVRQQVSLECYACTGSPHRRLPGSLSAPIAQQVQYSTHSLYAHTIVRSTRKSGSR